MLGYFVLKPFGMFISKGAIEIFFTKIVTAVFILPFNLFIAGIEFIVMYDLYVKEPNSPEAHFLCLLCERRLSEHECYDHAFSREHVAKFLVNIFFLF